MVIFFSFVPEECTRFVFVSIILQFQIRVNELHHQLLLYILRGKKLSLISFMVTLVETTEISGKNSFNQI